MANMSSMARPDRAAAATPREISPGVKRVPSLRRATMAALVMSAMASSSISGVTSASALVGRNLAPLTCSAMRTQATPISWV